MYVVVVDRAFCACGCHPGCIASEENRRCRRRSGRWPLAMPDLQDHDVFTESATSPP